MSTNEVKSTNIPALDGVRGLAILLVMSTHFFYKTPLFNLGWTGVDLFFVLSGYLLCSKFIKYKISKDLILTFFRNRLLRTLPIYFLLLLFFISLYFLIPVGKRNLLFFPLDTFFILSHLALIQNWYYIFISQPYTPVGHLWSVSVEEQFYLFFPFLILLIEKLKLKLLFIIVMLGGVLMFRSIDLYCYGMLDNSKSVINFQRYSFNTFYRMDSFLAGIMLAYVLYHYKKIKLLNKIVTAVFVLTGLCIIIFFGYFQIFSSSSALICSVGYTTIALFFASVIYFVIQKKYSLLNTFFSSKLLIFSGKISYGLYVYHYVLDFYNSSLLGYVKKLFPGLPNNQFVSILFSLFLIAMAYLISYTSYIFVEKKFLQFKRAYSNFPQKAMANA